MNKISLALVAVIGLSLAGYVALNRGPAPEALSLTAVAQETSTETATTDLPAVVEMQLGNPDAKVTVIEYASFTCPHCANFHKSVFKDLRSNYIDTGKIHFIYREVYFDRFGLWGAMLARCGGEARYFGVADMLYTGQRDWIGSGEPAEVAANLRRIGKTAGLTDDQLTACLEDGAMAQALVASYQANATADDIDSTPSFVINGTKYSNMNYADFAKLLDEKLAE
ncbi:MAG: DsbA family protein [Paracoccaceae bacterium]